LKGLFQSITFKIGAGVLLTILTALSMISYFAGRHFYSEADRLFHIRVKEIGVLVAHGQLSYDVVSDPQIIKDILDEELVDGMVVGADGFITHALNPKDIGTHISEVSDIDQEWFKTTGQDGITEEVEDDGSRYLVSVTPLPQENGQYAYVFLKVGIDQVAIVKQAINTIFVVTTLVISILSLLVVILLFRVVILTRIDGLIEMVNQMKDGNLSARMVGKISSDEIGALQSGINSMAANLHMTLETLNERVDDLNEADTTLREREERLQLALRGGELSLWDFNLETGEEFQDQRWAEMLGYSPDEIQEQPIEWENHVHPDEISYVKESFDTHLSGDAPFYEAEYRVRTKSGKWIWILARGQVVEYGLDGKPLRVTGTNQDVTARKQVEDLQHAIYNISEASSSAQNLDALYRYVHEIVAELLPAENFYIALYNPEAGRISFPYFIDEYDTSEPEDMLIDDEENRGGVTAHLLRTGEPLFVNKETISGLVAEGVIDLVGELSLEWLGVPLKTVDGNVIGVLTVQTYTEGVSYTEKDKDILVFVSTQIAMAIERKRSEEKIQRQLQRLAALRKIDTAIISTFDQEVVLNTLLEQIVEQLNVDAAAILNFDQETETLVFAAARGFRTKALRHTRLSLGEGFAGQAALQRKMVHVDNIGENPRHLKRSPTLEKEEFVAYFGIPLIAKDQVEGVLELLHRSPLNPDKDWFSFMEALAGQTAIAIDNAELFSQLQDSNEELRLAYDITLEGWALALELRDVETEGHTRRVMELTLDLAREIGVDDEHLVDIRRGAILHDIGKMGIPDSILFKPGPLTSDEWRIMKKHPRFAAQMLAGIDFLKPALDIVLYHHEKWDGRGYPRGLKTDEIPLPARIFAVVDVYDSLTHKRPYKNAWPEDEATQYIQEEAGKHFDPAVVNHFLKVLEM
jgi:PAS domain S-box-containing protein/putative nucleotidyltransferase with HDIG domain